MLTSAHEKSLSVNRGNVVAELTTMLSIGVTRAFHIDSTIGCHFHASPFLMI